MAETNNNWWGKIEKSDGIATRNTREQVAIDFLNKNRTILPPDCFAKLVEETVLILKRGEIEEGQICKECEKELEKLRGKTFTEEGMGYLEAKMVNISTEQDVKDQLGLSFFDSLEEKGFSDKGVHGFNKERGNFFITIQEFEGILRDETNVRNINSRALANYLTYLLRKGQLTSEILIKRFGGNTLSQLGKLWQNGGNPKEGSDSLIAYRILEKNNLNYIITVINLLSSQKNFLDQIEPIKDPKEQMIVILLLKENKDSLRDKFKQELKADLIKRHPTMKDIEADAIIEKVLTKVLSYEGVEGLTKIYQTLNEYSKGYGVEVDVKKATTEVQTIQKAQKQLKIAENQLTFSNEKDSSKKKELQKIGEIERQRLKDNEMAMKVNEKMKESDIKDLISGEKKIDQVIEELRREDKEFDKEYTVWEKSKELLKGEEQKKEIQKHPQNKGGGDNTYEFSQIDFSKTPLHEIIPTKIGDISFGIRKDTEDTSTVLYKGMEISGIETKNLSEVPEMVRFIESTGLDVFGTHISDILAIINNRQTKQGGEEQINLKNGLGSNEKHIILRSMAEILMPGVDTSNKEKLEENFKNIQRSGGMLEYLRQNKKEYIIATDNSININAFKNSLKKTV